MLRVQSRQRETCGGKVRSTCAPAQVVFNLVITLTRLNKLTCLPFKASSASGKQHQMVSRISPESPRFGLHFFSGIQRLKLLCVFLNLDIQRFVQSRQLFLYENKIISVIEYYIIYYILYIDIGVGHSCCPTVGLLFNCPVFQFL